MKLFFVYYQTPIGIIEICSNEIAIVGCNFVDKMHKDTEKTEILDEALEQLDSYFKGKRTNFDLKLFLDGTEFQKKVWKELQKIPFGYTVSYKEIANRIGRRNAVRAVGNANGKNPVSIIVPCHRVIGSDGQLIGYGGGIEKKKWLIQFEKSILIGHMH